MRGRSPEGGAGGCCCSVSGEARILTVRANGCALNPHSSTVRFARRRYDAGAETGGRGGLPWPESSSNGGGDSELRRWIPAAWPHDPGEDLRGKDAGVRGYIVEETRQAFKALIARNQGGLIHGHFQNGRTADVIPRHHFFLFFFYFFLLNVNAYNLCFTP